jgi:hypothetical protein
MKRSSNEDEEVLIEKNPGLSHLVRRRVRNCGMGEKFDKASMKDLPAGGYALLPAEMRHFAMAKTAATIQVHGQGPFALTYVNPADDPSKRVPTK